MIKNMNLEALSLAFFRAAILRCVFPCGDSPFRFSVRRFSVAFFRVARRISVAFLRPVSPSRFSVRLSVAFFRSDSPLCFSFSFIYCVFIIHWFRGSSPLGSVVKWWKRNIFLHSVMWIGSVEPSVPNKMWIGPFSRVVWPKNGGLSFIQNLMFFDFLWFIPLFLWGIVFSLKILLVIGFKEAFSRHFHSKIVEFWA